MIRNKSERERTYHMIRNYALDGLMGLCVGDALGVPVEFQSRETLNIHPVLSMRGYGTYHQPPGSWSDDSSLTFILTQSLCHGYDLWDIADGFIRWFTLGEWTPRQEVFDIGISTREAILRLMNGSNPVEAGGKEAFSNGNGSLMRILPVVFYTLYWTDTRKRFQVVQEVSSLTHGHPISLLACSIYVEYVIQLMKTKSREIAYQNMKEVITRFYHFIQEDSFLKEREVSRREMNCLRTRDDRKPS
ncbi:hypothetical protein FC694_23985 [Bacillus wiedmannii]|uniref:ADP-ribosylglycohydrolase n=1 Tax=Bacillus wiedmannii TaxID=1890302 RepID=A0A4U2MK68_9BACI|nr:ADP-ribosylglycohydrolase family protein [Bacillus wiedmannii]TKH11346.1 hypothetical protein FC694_23985 [Bacillus wiedmannii]